MVVKEDGTKWACQSCLKGHRVSGCTHTDRPLFFVPKKGRPVTQCQHCRVERKKRSAHVKCDCGEKHHTKDKCIHLRNTEGHGDLSGGELDPVPEDEEAGCCCSHGGKCTCSTLKKEPGTDDHPTLHHVRSKPRLSSTQSDGHITVFTNGHHRPVHRHNHAAHDSLPYKLPRSHTDHTLQPNSRRSIDSLSDKIKGAQSLPSQAVFNFATPPIEPESGRKLNNMSTENVAMEGFPFAMDPNPSVGSNSVDLFDFSQLDSAQVNGFDNLGMSASQTDSGMTAPTMPYNAPLSASSIEPTFDWSNIDWSNINAFDDAQPALTYASSNTHSEYGEHTPPEEIGSMFGNRTFMRSMHDMPTQMDQSTQTIAGAEVVAVQDQTQSANQPARWSLPHSFWTGAAFPSSNTSTESISTNSSAWLQPQPANVTSWPAPPNPVARNQTMGATSRPRPKAVYQRSNTTMPGGPGWEKLLSNYQADDLWNTEEVEQTTEPMQMTSTECMPMVTEPMQMTTTPGSIKTTGSISMDNVFDQSMATSMLQRSDSDQQFFMDPEAVGNFDFSGNFSNSSYANSMWPQ